MEIFHSFSNFSFWNSFIRDFNPGISFVVFSLHISRDEINMSLDSNSNSIDIVTKFRDIKLVFFELVFGFGFLRFGHSQGDNLTKLVLITAF